MLLSFVGQATNLINPNSEAMAIGVLFKELLYALGGLVALWFAWRVLEWGWLIPRRLGRALRAQGLHGTAYRFPAGDLKKAERRLAAERAKPMPLLSHDISVRAQPLVHETIKEHGTPVARIARHQR
jgi:hypothetical protein